MRSPYLEHQAMIDSWYKKEIPVAVPNCWRIHDKYNTCSCSCHRENSNSEYEMCEECYEIDKCYLCYECNNFIKP